jgi:hypothetical protein
MTHKRMIATAAAGIVAGSVGALTALKVQDNRYVAGVWQELERAPTAGGVFDEAMVADLPDVARRYFLHAIQPGTPLATQLHWHYTAEMKPGANLPWMPLEADQILVKERGFVWKATAQMGPLIVTATDHYLNSNGRMRIALFGLVPIISATGPDLSRSAMARLVIEGVTLPSTLLPGPNVNIEVVDSSRFSVITQLDGETTPITVAVDPSGRPMEVTMQRWGNLTDDGSYQFIPYGMQITGERTFDGYTIPTEVAGGWWYGTEQYLEVIRLSVDRARLS